MNKTLPLTIQLIIAEFEKRGIRWEHVESGSPAVFMRYFDASGRSRYLRATLTDTTGAVGFQIAGDKLTSAAIAANLGITVPAATVYSTLESAHQFADDQKCIVVKPLDSAHGNGVSVNVTTANLDAAIALAGQFSKTIILQQQIQGRDLRLLYIGGRFAAAVERRPASVVGDGTSTIRELIEQTNASPERGENYQTKYNVIPLKSAETFLGERLSGIPDKDEVVQVVGTANVGSGGTAIDVTDELPKGLIESGLRIVQELRLGVCGVDFIEGPDGVYLIEINTAPTLGFHHYPHEGEARDVTAQLVDFLVAGP